MTLASIKILFQNELSKQYSSSEISQLFTIFATEFTKLSTTDLRHEMHQVIDHQLIDRFKTVISQLRTDQPYQQILGKAEFFGFSFFVNEHVLIPRPETEELLEIALKKIGNRYESKVLKVLEIGTGSGIIPIILKKKWRNAEITSIDISSEALQIARKNAAFHHCHIDFKEANYLTLVLTEKYDVIISNPPYIGIDEAKELETSVTDFEPQLALFSPNTNPLTFYEKIAADCKTNLAEDGCLFVEINQKLGLQTNALFENVLKEAQLLKDLSGNDRFVVGGN